MPRKLTPVQLVLLREIAATRRGILYIRRYSRSDRTVAALVDRDLIWRSEPDHSAMAQDGWSLTDAGRAHLQEVT